MLTTIQLGVSTEVFSTAVSQSHAYHERDSFHIEPAGNNPFATVYQVLKYSWKHKVPERRSAFTYWEEDIPRRIDLGKNKYGYRYRLRDEVVMNERFLVEEIYERQLLQAEEYERDKRPENLFHVLYEIH